MQVAGDRLKLHAQTGQSMVEYTVVLSFGVLVLISGEDIFITVRDVLRDNYEGYSYSISLSEQPVFDNLAEYLIDEDIIDPINPNELVDKIQDYLTFPTLEGFPSDMPTSAADVLDGATSFF